MNSEQPGLIVRFETRHGPMLSLSADQYFTTSFELYGEFSGFEWKLFSQLVRPGITVVEVGSNIGAHTIPLARQCAPGKLYAFEPQQRIFQLLCANLALNEITNALAFPEACGGQEGWASIPTLDYAADNNFGAVSLTSAQTGARVRVATLDSYQIQECGFLKIDVEGLEHDVLMGAQDLIRRTRPILYVEADRPAKQQAVIDLIDQLGYRMWWHTPPLFDPGNFKAQPVNVFGRQRSLNLLCLPKELDDDVGGQTPIDPRAWTAPG